MRALYDERFRNVVAPHFITAFRAEGFDRKAYTEHVAANAAATEHITFAGRYAMLGANDERAIPLVFLVTDEGSGAISQLHDTLQTGFRLAGRRISATGLSIPDRSHLVPNDTAILRTSDGECATHIMTPEGDGPWPATIMYMDAGGIRPGMVEMAERLADAGYVVMLPDLFYRYGPYGPFVPKEVFAGDFRAVLGPLMATTDNLKAAADTKALLDHLDTRNDVAGRRVGAVGFCMGGGMAIAAAAAYPDRFAAVASYHGGNLATDAPTSPHLGAPRIDAEVYIAAAENDRSYPPEMAAKLEAALTEAGVSFGTKTYPAAHGWMMPDFPVYDHDAAEQGWSDMTALFRRTLR